jgi:hypothetical protein
MARGDREGLRGAGGVHAVRGHDGGLLVEVPEAVRPQVLVRLPRHPLLAVPPRRQSGLHLCGVGWGGDGEGGR